MARPRAWPRPAGRPVDLLFESPTGLWDRGSYVLAIGHNHGVAELPIELRWPTRSGVDLKQRL
jgi:hypothetical protein